MKNNEKIERSSLEITTRSYPIFKYVSEEIEITKYFN
jgi:hypothetical protein